ncbi:MAG: hypothetical protein ABL889_05950 [Terricaulis sp.]
MAMLDVGSIGSMAMREYTKLTISPESEVSRFVKYSVTLCEIEADKVLREVWVLPDGRTWRRSIERDFNEEPGSLRGNAPRPGPRWEQATVEWSTAEEFEDMWVRAEWGPDASRA